jgi:hypothetical protein
MRSFLFDSYKCIYYIIFVLLPFIQTLSYAKSPISYLSVPMCL